MSQFNLSFHPRLITSLKDYDRARFWGDVGAGITVAIVALPLAMAFAIASGVTPEAGIFTAIIAGFLISALGGSRVQIGGPAGAFIVIIYGIIEKYGLANLLISTIFAGVLLFAMGFFRLGSLIRYIPVPIVLGFTNGIAVLIALSQLKDFFGLQIAKMPGDFFAQIATISAHAGTFNSTACAIALLSLAVLVVWPRLFRAAPESESVVFEGHIGRVGGLLRGRVTGVLRVVPAPMVVLVLATAAVSLLGLNVDTIGSRFGGVPQTLPSFTLPVFSWDLVKQLFAPTITIALLGAIESLLCARIADNLIHDRHDPNQELMAQGIANLITPFFGGLPATGTIARTVTNIRAGASSPVAGMVHAVTLLLIVLVAAPLATNVPLAALAAILMLVAYNMGEWNEFRRLLRFSINYRALVIVTFLLTVVIDLTVAVEVGLVMACLFFIYRISSLTTIEPIEAALLPRPLPHGVQAYAIFGSLFFGAVGKLEALLDTDSEPPRVMILELHQLINLDTTGMEALEQLHNSLAKQSCRMLICGANHQPLSLMQRTGFLHHLGAENCLSSLEEAIAAIEHDVPRAAILRA